MAYVECANGHVYDSDQYAYCPYCNGGGNRIDFGAGAASGVGRTMPLMGGDIGETLAPRSYHNEKSGDTDTGKTVAVLQKNMNVDPVVGWLVCVDGSDKGKDYRILARNNTIGRGERMDICIKGDNSISRENHARLGYDDKHNVFHLIPADAKNNIYLNDEPVYVPTKLSSYDVVELGETKLMFVPFCSDRFTWKDGLNTGENS